MIIVWLKKLRCNIRCPMCTLKNRLAKSLIKRIKLIEDHYFITAIYILPVGVMQSYMLLT
jgi:hypothetical protein